MHDHITAAISAASAPELDRLVKAITAAWAAGTLDDDAFSAAYAAAHRRRADLKEKPSGLPLHGGQGIAPPRRSIFPPRRLQKSPDRHRSIERRRRLAASGPMPPALAARFTVAELACLRIVGDEVRAHGVCSLTIAEIAARAGVCRTSAQNALRAAARAGMMHVEERRQPIMPVPNDAPKLTGKIVDRCAPEGYTFTKAWGYRDSQGRLLGCTVRYDTPSLRLAGARGPSRCSGHRRGG